MERILTFKDRLGTWDIPAFAYTDNEPVEIFFNFETQEWGRYIATFVCGDEKYTATLPENCVVELPAWFVKKGGYNPIYVHLEVRSWQTDRIVIPDDLTLGGYAVEPLYVQTVEHNATAHAWFARIEGILTEYGNRLKAAEDKLAEYKEQGVPLVANENYENEKLEGEHNNEI